MGKGEGDKVKFSGKNGKYGVRDRPPGELETAVLTGNPRIQDVCEDTQQ